MGRLTFGSLFAGIGGFDKGFVAAGMTLAWSAEIDKKCNQIREMRLPKHKVIEDVKDVGRDTERVDVICGGFPCQDLSVAGKRKGLAGERSGLWYEFHRILDELRPRVCVIENVPGLLSSNGGNDFAVLIRGLAQLGYGVSWRVLDSQYFGVAQRRRRVFIVGSLGDGRAAEILFEPESVCVDTPPSREKRQVASTLFASGAGTSRPAGTASEDGFLVPQLSSGKDTAPTIMANYGTKWGLGDQEAFTGDYSVIANPLLSHPHGTGSDEDTQTLISHTWKASGGLKMDETHETYIPIQYAEQHDRDTRETGIGLGDVGDPMYTLECRQAHGIAGVSVVRMREGCEGGGKGPLISSDKSLSLATANDQTIFGTAVRRLTPVECERLQGFPDGWTLPFADSVRYRMLGNAVTVNVAEWLGQRIANG